MKTVLFTYFYKELGAFGHEPEDEGWCDAGDGAESHKHSPALKDQRSQREEWRGSWYHHPGQTWRNRFIHDEKLQIRSFQAQSLSVWSKTIKVLLVMHSQQFLRRQRAMNNNGVFANTSSFYFLQLPTCSQDVSCHPECGQRADHRSSPKTGHELGEIGENDRYWPPDPAEEKKNCCSNSDSLWHVSCLSTPKRSLKLAGVVLTRCHWWTSAAGRART